LSHGPRPLRERLAALTFAVHCALVLAAAPARAQCTEPYILTAPDGAAADQFGYDGAIDGDTMIVGAPFDDVGASADQGSAYVFRFNGSI